MTYPDAMVVRAVEEHILIDSHRTKIVPDEISVDGLHALASKVFLMGYTVGSEVESVRLRARQRRERAAKEAEKSEPIIEDLSEAAIEDLWQLTERGPSPEEITEPIIEDLSDLTKGGRHA